MEIIKMNTRLTAEEKETHLNYDYVENKWVMYSVISTHFNKALKQGWIPLVKYVYQDGTVAGYSLEAPGRAITIRSVDKKVLSEKQMTNLLNK
jgi:hypothetical protein